MSFVSLCEAWQQKLLAERKDAHKLLSIIPASCELKLRVEKAIFLCFSPLPLRHVKQWIESWISCCSPPCYPHGYVPITIITRTSVPQRRIEMKWRDLTYSKSLDIHSFCVYLSTTLGFVVRMPPMSFKKRTKSQVLPKSFVFSASPTNWNQLNIVSSKSSVITTAESFEEGGKVRRPFIERLKMELEKIDFHLRVVWLLKFILHHGIKISMETQMRDSVLIECFHSLLLFMFLFVCAPRFYFCPMFNASFFQMTD